MTLDVAVPPIVALGFKKRKAGIFTIELAPGILGWLGLNRATKYRAKGEIEVFPIIGVRFQEVERLVADCRREKFHSYLPPTISCPLGQVMPESRYRAWVFPAITSVDVAFDMAQAIATYGVPFMRSVTTLSELRQRINDGYGHTLEYKGPVAALLAGDAEQARTLLDNVLTKFGNATYPAANDFRNFARNLQDRIS